jgi:hypothetical protein
MRLIGIASSRDIGGSAKSIVGVVLFAIEHLWGASGQSSSVSGAAKRLGNYGAGAQVLADSVT